MNIMSFHDIHYVRMPEWVNYQANFMQHLWKCPKTTPTREYTDIFSKPMSLEAEVFPTCHRNRIGVSVKKLL